MNLNDYTLPMEFETNNNQKAVALTIVDGVVIGYIHPQLEDPFGCTWGLNGTYLGHDCNYDLIPPKTKVYLNVYYDRETKEYRNLGTNTWATRQQAMDVQGSGIDRVAKVLEIEIPNYEDI